MRLLDHFSEADVTLGVAARNKEKLLGMMAGEASARLGLPAEEIVGALEAREALGSTALGEGVALPHAKLASAAAPLVLFARLETPIEFDARDGDPVDLVFLVLWPMEDGKGLLDTMASTCRALRDSALIRRLRRAASPEDVVRLVRHHAEAPPSEEDDDNA